MQKYNIGEHLLFPPTYLNKKKLNNKLEGKTILITGASFGIGEELAYSLADIDLHMILVARTEEKLLLMKNEIEEKTAQVSIIAADLRNQEEIADLISFLQQLPNSLDYFISNAGKSIRRSIIDSLDRYHDFTRTMAINYFAPVQLLLSVIPLIQKNNGHIINISTVNVLLLPVPFWASYQASKSAFDTWFRSVSPELNALGISTTSIYLPLVRTRMIQPTRAYDNMPAMSPNHVAKIICKSIITKKKKFKPWWLIFGQLSSVIFRGILDSVLPIIIMKRGKAKNV
jgi:short-subunit dehydrogenase